MDGGERLGQEPVAGHGKEDPRLAELEDEQNGRVRHHRAERHEGRPAVLADRVQRDRQGLPLPALQLRERNMPVNTAATTM